MRRARSYQFCPSQHGRAERNRAEESARLFAIMDHILSPQAKFAALGVTSFQEVYPRDMDRMQAYFNLARRGEMSIRSQVMNVLEYSQELDGRIEAIEAMRYEDDFMHFAGAKGQLDGAAEAAFTNEPHDGMAWNLSKTA